MSFDKETLFEEVSDYLDIEDEDLKDLIDMIEDTE